MLGKEMRVAEGGYIDLRKQKGLRLPKVDFVWRPTSRSSAICCFGLLVLPDPSGGDGGEWVQSWETR